MSSFAIPSLTELRTMVEEKFNIGPCIFQARAALVQLEQKDCVTISPTGSGKTFVILSVLEIAVFKMWEKIIFINYFTRLATFGVCVLLN